MDRCGKCGATVSVNTYDYPHSQVTCSTYRARSRAACAGIWYSRRNLEDQVALWLGGHIAAWAAATPDD